MSCSCTISVGFKSKRGQKRHKGERHREKRRSHVKTKAETGVTVSWVRKCQELSDTGRGKESSPLDLLKGSRPCPHLDFGLPASRTARHWTLLLWVTMFVVICFGRSRKWIQCTLWTGHPAFFLFMVEPMTANSHLPQLNSVVRALRDRHAAGTELSYRCLLTQSL